MDDITLATLAISSASIVIVIVSTILQRRQVTTQYHDNPDANIEISAIVSEFSQRMKRLEENLVDQKVKLEIQELRAQRGHSAISPSSGIPRNYNIPGSRMIEGTEIQAELQHTTRTEQTSPIANPPVRTTDDQTINVDRRPGSTEREALRMVHEGRGKTTAKDIQQRIGRTREHTARMMNSLFQEGLVERDVTARPFSYSITQKGRELLNS